MRKLNIESLETRRLLVSEVCNDELTHLCDDFEDPATLQQWSRVNETEGWHADQLQVWDIDQSQPGRMYLQPHTTSWYQNWRGPMAFQDVTGDFVFTTEVHVGDRDDVGDNDADDVPDGAAYSLAGLMIRTPRAITDPTTDWQPGTMQDDGTNQGENYVFLSLGYGASGSDFQMEVKTTRNSDSNLQLVDVPGADSIELRIARIDDAVIVLYRTAGEEWTVHRRYRRPDMPETLQAGLVTYTDWNKVNDFDPFYHNSHVLDDSGFDPTPNEPFQPDLRAGFEYTRYQRPQVPAELTNVDLINQATDDQLLSFLGNDPVEPPATVVGLSVNSAEFDPGDLPTGPQPTSWQQQHSSIRSLDIEFSQPVLLGVTDLVLTNLGVNAQQDPDTLVDLTNAQLTHSGNVVTVMFPEGLLADGVYQVEVLDTIEVIGGANFDGDTDGLPGGSYLASGTTSNGLFQLQGEWNGDGGVSVFDFSTLSYWFGIDTTLAPRYVDLNGDGGISVFDFSGFSAQFGTSIQPLPPALTNPPTRTPARAETDDSAPADEINDVALSELLREWSWV